MLVTTPGAIEGTDETVDSLLIAAPKRKVLGLRRATVSIQGFGADTQGWLENAILALQTQTQIDAFGAAGVGGPVPLGAIADISILLGTAWEPRFALSVDVPYTLQTSDAAAESPTALATVQDAWTLDGTDPSDMTFTDTITI